MLPLSKPIIAVNLLFYALAQWNSCFSALIYTDHESVPAAAGAAGAAPESEVDPSLIGGNLAEILADGSSSTS